MSIEPNPLDDFKRCIFSLNHEYNLDIREPDPTLSPSKRRLAVQPIGERIYLLIHALSFRLKPRLLSGLEQFRREAYLLRQSSDHDAFSQQAQLQNCLISCLPDPKILLQKRTASGPAEQPKRLRSQRSDENLSLAKPTMPSALPPFRDVSLGQTCTAASIDDIPVRSSPTFLKRDRPESIVIDSDSGSDTDPVFSGRRACQSSHTTSANTSFTSTSTEPATAGISSALQEMEIASNISQLHDTDKDPPASEENLASKLRNVWRKLTQTILVSDSSLTVQQNFHISQVLNLP
jgi:hypothetical protein